MAKKTVSTPSIKATIPMVPRYVWSRAIPTVTGRWFYRDDGDSEGRIVRVFRSQGDLEMSYRYGRAPDAVNYCLNAKDAWWAGPVLLPLEPRDSEDTSSA